MNEFFVTRWKHSRDAREPEPVIYRKVGDQWHKIAVPAGESRPFYAPDGKTLHYGANYKERTTDGWSELKSLGPSFEAIRIMSLSASAKGTLVLDERGSSAGDGTLRYSRLVSGKWQDPKPLPKQINTGTWNAHPYIAPDESYLMWDGERESGYGDADLYISFRQKDGSWGELLIWGTRSIQQLKRGAHRSHLTVNFSSSIEWCQMQTARQAFNQIYTGLMRRSSKT